MSKEFDVEENGLGELDVDALMASADQVGSDELMDDAPIESAPQAHAATKAPVMFSGVRSAEGVMVELKAELGSALVSLGELAALRVGSTLTLNTTKDDPIRIVDVRGTEVAKGTIELIDGAYTIVITEVMGDK